jgi:hypothetical protein
MKLHGFLCHWKGHEENAVTLQKKIEPFIDLTVISTDDSLQSKHPDWVYLNETAYFSEQWNKAAELFSGDIFFQVQADVSFDDFERLFEKVRSQFRSHPIGVYEPCIEFSGFQCNKSDLPHIAESVYQVPLTDSICWFIAGDILRQLPRIDPSVNFYGWGVCAAISALSHLNNKLSVRDYEFKVHHPRTRGYRRRKALEDRARYMESLGPTVVTEMESIYKRIRELKISR